jgi:YVTN family beta-propeller protein
MTRHNIFTAGVVALFLSACSKPAEAPKPVEKPAATYHVYATNETSNNVSVIDPTTNEVVATVDVGKRPRGIHVSPDRKTVYVALSGTPIGGPGVDEKQLLKEHPADKAADGIGVIDVAQNKMVKTIPGGSDPEEFSLSLDGTLLYISNEDDSAASILEIATGKILASFKVGDEPEGVATSPDGQYVWVTSEQQGTVSVIDTTKRKVIKTIKIGSRPRKVAFLPNGSKAFVTRENDGKFSIVDMAKLVVTGEVELGKAGEIKPMGMAVSSDGAKLYVSTGRGKKVYVVDTATNKVDTSFEVGDRPWGIGISPDGKFLYTANGPSNDVSVVDLATNTVVKKIKAGDKPWGIVIVGN